MRRYTLLAVVLCSLLLQSCANYGRHAYGMRDGLRAGQLNKALAVAEATDPSQSEVVASLDKGMLRRFNGNYSGSNAVLEVAKQNMEALYGTSLTESVASVTVNDTLSGYQGDPYEQLLVHAFMAKNYIELADLYGARVEMQQANIKLKEWGLDDNTEFYVDEDPYVRYFEGMIYESLGELDNAIVSYRKAYKLYQRYAEQNPGLYSGVPDYLKQDLLRTLSWQGARDEFEQLEKAFELDGFKPYATDSGMGEVIVILNNGLAPIRSQTAIPIFSPEVQKNLRVAFPVYKEPRKDLLRAQVEINGESHEMLTVQNIDALARYSLEQAMPGIMARATARAVVKYNTQNKAHDQGSLAGFLVTVTNIATEQADTRSWTTLPQEIQLSRVVLPAGEHVVKISLQDQYGGQVKTLRQKVRVSAGKPTFVIKHYWRTRAATK